MVYKVGKGSPNTENPTYSGDVYVVPGVVYRVKLEILQNDLGHPEKEKVEDIQLDGRSIGECNPPGLDLSCNFYECGTDINSNEVSSTTGSINIKLFYKGNSQDCDCNEETWECSPEQGKPGHVSGRTSMQAAARLTLTPIRNKKGYINTTDL